MEDKEVGELWRKRLIELEHLYLDRKGASAFELDIVIALIRKLVEERARRRWYGSGWRDGIPNTLHDFGIDPATWTNNKL